MPISGPGRKIPGVDAGDTVVPVQFNKVKVGDKVVVVLRGSHGGRYVGSCAGIGGGKLHLGGSIYYTENKKGGLKRNVSKGALDFDKEDVMSCWAVTPAAPPPQQRVLARSKKRNVELRVEEEDEDEEAGNEEEEEEEEEDGDEVVELGDKGKKAKTPEKGKAPQKKRLPIPFFPDVHEGREGGVGEEGQASKKSRKEKDPEDEETKEVCRMNLVLEEYGTAVHHLARHVQCLRGQPGSKLCEVSSLDHFEEVCSGPV